MSNDNQVLLQGNSLEVLKDFPDNSVDSVVTDPPYGLSFMGKKWDYDVPSKELWVEVLRVLKPGGHLLSFGGTRTYHRMVVAIEDAGFEIRDQVQWLYGSGFPKSHDVSKGMDKQAGVEREVIGPNPNGRPNMVRIEASVLQPRVDAPLSKPSTDLAKQWQGWGTALKPANEPICLARKPLEKGLTVAENVAKWGTGAINIDASRIGTEIIKTQGGDKFKGKVFGKYATCEESTHQGRWPANIILDETAAKQIVKDSKLHFKRDGWDLNYNFLVTNIFYEAFGHHLENYLWAELIKQKVKINMIAKKGLSCVLTKKGRK